MVFHLKLHGSLTAALAVAPACGALRGAAAVVHNKFKLALAGPLADFDILPGDFDGRPNALDTKWIESRFASMQNFCTAQPKP